MITRRLSQICTKKASAIFCTICFSSRLTPATVRCALLHNSCLCSFITEEHLLHPSVFCLSWTSANVRWAYGKLQCAQPLGHFRIICSRKSAQAGFEWCFVGAGHSSAHIGCFGFSWKGKLVKPNAMRDGGCTGARTAAKLLGGLSLAEGERATSCIVLLLGWFLQHLLFIQNIPSFCPLSVALQNVIAELLQQLQHLLSSFFEEMKRRSSSVPITSQ